jgi:VWFA-related protein
MRAVTCLIAAFLLNAGVAFQTGQSPSAIPPQSADQVPVFRASARLVQVSVVVHDSHGHPVDDLKTSDFAVTENGKPQQISFFSMTSADKSAAPPVALPPHIFSNVLAEKRDVPTSVTVVLIDLLNTSWTDQQYARKALLKFFQQIQPQDRVAIFALGRRSLTLLHDYTTDSASLIARLQKATGEIPSELDASTLNANTQSELQSLGLDAMADANQREADFFTAGRIVNTLSTLEAIAQHLSGVPGRKNLIWLSGGFPLTIGFDEVPAIGSTRDQRTFTRETDAAVRALNNSGVAVYPVDARGLMVLPGFDASVRGVPRVNPSATVSRMASINANMESMKELASRTGGRAAYNTNDLARAIRQAIDDSRVTYTIGYYSTDDRQDGKFRPIHVKVNRPHVDVRYRKGYFALKPADDTAKTRKDEIRGAVWSPLESTALAINARADIIDQPAPNTVNVTLQIDSAGVGFRKEGDRWKAEIDVVYVQKDEHGRLLGDGVTDNVAMALTDANYLKAAKEGLFRQRRVPRQPGAISMRVVVRDVASGSVGSLTIPFSQISDTPQGSAPK